MGWIPTSDDYSARIEEARQPDGELPQSPEQEDLAKISRIKFDEAHEARLPYERDWELNRQYIKGDQMIVRNRESGEVLRLSTEDSRKLRSVFNVMRPTVRSFLGKLTRTIPTCETLPATSDFSDQEGSRAATAMLEWARRDQDLDRKWVRANSFLPFSGNGIFSLCWDNAKGRKIAVCPVCSFFEPDEGFIGEECPRCAQQRANEVETQRVQFETAQMQEMARVVQEMPPGVEPDPMMAQGVEPPPMQQAGPLGLDEEIPIMEEAYEGSIDVRVPDIRDFFIDPSADCLEKAGWVCLRRAMHMSDIQQTWPHLAGLVSAENDIQSDKSAQLRYDGIDPYGDVYYLKDHAYVFEFHERPTFKHPKGRMYFMVNDKIIQEMESPYWEVLGRFPFYHIGLDKNVGEFWREPWANHAWHRQRELNQVETQVREHTHLLLRPKILNPLGSKVNADEFTTTTGQVIKYNPAMGPLKVLEWPQLPSQVFLRKQELIDDIRLLAGVTEQDAGISQSDPNGRAMAIVEAESDQQMGPMLVENFAEWRELHRGIIQLMLEYAHPTTTWSIVGPEGMQTYSLHEITLSPGWDVQVEQSDGLSRNPAIRLQQSMDLLNAGVFTDPQTGVPDMKAFMRQAKLNIPRAGFDMEATERAAAAQIPEQLKKGIMHSPQPENDPMIFAETLLGWLRGPGRKEKDQMFVQQIRQIWMFYAGWAGGQPPEGLGAQPSAPDMGPGADMSGAGGSTNNPGHIPSGAGGSAQQRVQQADAQAESAARGAAPHEG